MNTWDSLSRQVKDKSTGAVKSTDTRPVRDVYAQGMMAPQYSALTFPVAAGAHCIYEGELYAAKQAIAASEAWTAAHWDKVQLGAEVAEVGASVADLKSQIDEISEKGIDASGASDGQVPTADGQGSWAWDDPAGGGGGGAVWDGCVLLGSGTIPSGSASAENYTGITYGDIKKYKRVIFTCQASSNTSQGNISYGFGVRTNAGYKTDKAHIGIVYERCSGYLYKAIIYSTNTSVYMPIKLNINSVTGTPFEAAAIDSSFIPIGVSFADIRDGRTNFSDESQYCIFTWQELTADLNWRMWGLELL